MAIENHKYILQRPLYSPGLFQCYFIFSFLSNVYGDNYCDIYIFLIYVIGNSKVHRNLCIVLPFIDDYKAHNLKSRIFQKKNYVLQTCSHNENFQLPFGISIFYYK